VEHLESVFTYVCGSSHRWAPGGAALPFCQRCTGLYVGALMAAALLAVFRPQATRRFLAVHGLLLLVMVPFGLHLVPQNGPIRTLTGQLFAFGLVAYLGVLPGLCKPARQDDDGSRGWLGYGLAALSTIGLLQAAVLLGGRTGATALSFCGLAGLVVLSALALVNVVLIPRAVLSASASGGWGRPKGRPQMR
jgi:uncharacterized membrane protein